LCETQSVNTKNGRYQKAQYVI